MKILHLSDLHYKNKKNSKRDDYLKKIINEIKNDNIDLIIFNGDLVDQYNCDYEIGFTYLKNELIDKLNANYILCCGNHDVDRKNISDMFIGYVKNIKSEEEIYNFIVNDKHEDFSNNIRHIEKYNKIVNQNSNFKQKIYYNIAHSYTFTYNDVVIAVVTINLSWLAFGNDFGNLWFPEKILSEINNDIKNADFKILISHQPLSFLNNECFKRISNNIYKNYNCLFNGHTHQEDILTHISSSGGIFNCTAPAIMDVYEKNYPIGFTLLDFDFKKYIVNYKKYEYINSQDKMIIVDSNSIIIPIDKIKRQQIKIQTTILNKYDSIINEANNKFVPSFNENIDFKKMFTNPIIKQESYRKDIKFKKDKLIKSKNVNYEDFLKNDNCIIYGKDKSGKSALLYKIMIDLIEKIYSYNVIPIYFNLKFSYLKNEQIKIKEIIKNYYNFSNNEVDYILKNYEVKLLFDNFDINFKEYNNKLINDLENYKNISIILTSIDSYIDGHKINNIIKTNKYYLHNLNKMKIREITQKWPITSSYNKEEIVEKITSLFKQLNIHFNFWTVSLFLWIFQKTNNLNLHNNVELIDLYIENLLEKSNLILSLKSQTFSYENYRDFLSEIAYYLYNSKELYNYSCNYIELINCFQTYKKKNIRIVADSRDIIEYILNKGILIKIDIDTYTFRLNGIFEYFLARHMLKSNDFLKKIVEDSSLFLSFKNELEIYSGFKRDNEEILIQIYFNCLNAGKLLKNKIKSVEEISYDSITNHNIINELTQIATELKDEIKPLTYEEQDSYSDIFDNINSIESSVKKKIKYNISEINSEIYLRHLSILSRIFRNMDEIKDDKIINEIFNYIINQACISIVYSIEELIEEIKQSEDRISDTIDIIDFFKSFTPVFIHTFLHDDLAHPTLENIILKKIKVLKENINENQLLIFIHYFLIIEIDPEKYHYLLEELLSLINVFNINYSIFLKLLFYISFKCNDRVKLEELLKDDLEIVYKKLYPNKKRIAKGDINSIIKNIKKDI